MANLDSERTDLQNQQGGLDPKPRLNIDYNPNKRKRAIRRELYTRFYWLRDAPSRVEAEADWDEADKEYSMYVAPRDADDWQADIHLPDAFAAIQAQAQEQIERKVRPHLHPTEESDEPKAEFANAVINYNMNTTGYDYQYYLAKLAASIRGTSFLMDYWRTEKRVVKLPKSIKDGEIQYETKEIIDFDDDYTEWVPNEFIHIDEKANHIDDAIDMFRREILNVEEFHRKYDNKPGFFDAQYVTAGGDTSNRSIFQLPRDITYQDVEVLHYYNRSTDSYWVCANNVVITDQPLQTKHKELPVAVVYQYRVPGRFWGVGIPKVIFPLSEERKTIRNLNLDRQKLQIGGAFLHNSAFDIDDEDTSLYPGRFISVDTNGQPIAAALQKLEFGDVPPSYFRTEEVLLEDIRRAHGIDDRIQGVNSGGTATEAAILKESSLKRVNLISLSNEMDTIVRLGKIKWSNIQFFYPTPRMEQIQDGDKTTEKKTYRSITVQGQKFEIKDGEQGPALSLEDIQGASAIQLSPKVSKYINGDFDISCDADVYAPVSKAIEQTKKVELFSLMMSNPASIAIMDINSAAADVMKVNNIKADKWLKNPISAGDMMMLAESENIVMSAGQPLGPTKDATEQHTFVHLAYTKSSEFQSLQHEIQQLIMDHILAEHDANPATGASADLLGGYGLGQAPAPQGEPGSPLPPPGIQANTSQPQAQVADLQPTNFAAPE